MAVLHNAALILLEVLAIEVKMEYQDLPAELVKTLGPSLDFLTKSNIRFYVDDKPFIKKYWQYFYMIPCILIIFIAMSIHISRMIMNNLIYEVAYSIPLFLVFAQAILKAALIIPKSSEVTAIIQQFGMLWRPCSDLTKKQNTERNLLLQRLNFFNLMTYWISELGTWQYVLTPLLETLFRRFILKQECELLLPIACTYPFDPTKDWLRYIAVDAFLTYCTFLFVYIYVGTELLMITLCALLGIEFTILKDDLEHVKPVPNNIVQNGDEQEFTLKDFVKRHQKLITLSYKLDTAFNKMVFVNLFFVGLTTCFFRFAAQFAPGPTYMLNNYVAVFSSLLSVLYLCYYGELLTSASLRIGDTAFFNLWYKAGTHYQKTIALIIKRAQHPCCLTSLKYLPITLNTFTKVMSSTWSYFSLMNTVYEDENQLEK